MRARRGGASTGLSVLATAMIVVGLVAFTLVVSSDLSASRSGRTSSVSSTTVTTSSSRSSTSTTSSTRTSEASSPPAQASTGVIIPLFVNDTAARTLQIDQITEVRDSQPAVPIVVVVNINGGPGNYSTLLATQIRSMQATGITVLGYDPTWWAQRNVTVVEDVMRAWHSWYGVNGIYLDQMPNWNYNGPQGQWYYNGTGGEYIPGYFANLTAYGESLGMTEIMANAGADVPPDFIGSVDTIGVFENTYLPSLNLSAGWTSVAGLNAWHLDYSKSNFMFFSYGITSLDPSFVLAAANYYGYLYITNTTESAGYSVLTPYLSELVSILASTVAVPSHSSSPPAAVQGSTEELVSSVVPEVYAPGPAASSFRR